MMDLNKAIEEKCSSFATDLMALIQQEIKDLVQELLHPSHLPLGLKPGEKRSSNEIYVLTEELWAYIKKNPGLRIELIAKGMKRDTRELNLPVKNLQAIERIKKHGQKRSTTYTAVG